MSGIPEDSDPLRTLEDLTSRLERVLGGPVARNAAANVSNSSITISPGSFYGVLFALFGLVALIVAVAAVIITREQVAQLRHEVEAVRATADIATANDAQHARRLSTIEGELKVIAGTK